MAETAPIATIAIGVEHLHALWDHAPHAVWVHQQLRLVYVNQAAVTTLGASSAIDLLGRSPLDFVAAGSRDQVQERIDVILEEGQAVPMRTLTFARQDGSSFDAQVVAWPIDFAGAPAVQASFYDTTEISRAQVALRENEERFRTATRAVSDLLWTNDAAGYMRDEQPAWAAFTGQTQAEYEGYGWANAVHPEDAQPTIEAWSAVVAERKMFVFEHRVRRHDGVYRLFAIRALPVLHPDGSIREWVGVHTDITERRAQVEEIRRLNTELEERVRQRTAELEVSNRELQAFSYSVSHDLRAPLRTIDGFSLALEEDAGPLLSAEMRDYIRRIRAGVQRMGGLIDALLQLSRVTRAELDRVEIDLSQMAADAAEQAQRLQPDRPVAMRIAPGIRANGDTRLLQVALFNLIGNAFKFTTKVGNPAVEFGVQQRDGTTEYFVRDNGAGFDMQYTDKLFHAFQRLHGDKDFPGSGIGLATVQRVILRHGGTVRAQGSPGNGATFYFTLG